MLTLLCIDESSWKVHLILNVIGLLVLDGFGRDAQLPV